MRHDMWNGPVAVLLGDPDDSVFAVEWATREAALLDRRLLLLHLDHATDASPSPAHRPAPTEAGRVALTRAARVARRTDPRVEVAGEVLNGPPGRVLLERTAEFALLVVDRHSRDSCAGIPGSRASWLAANAWCPVVVVPVHCPASGQRDRPAQHRAALVGEREGPSVPLGPGPQVRQPAAPVGVA